MKKSQVTVFIIIGILIVISVAFVLLKNTNRQALGEFIVFDHNQVFSYVEDCMQTYLTTAVLEFGPDKDNIEDYLDSQVSWCADQLTELMPQVSIVYDKPKSTVYVFDTEVQADIIFPIIVTQGNEQSSRKQFLLTYSIQSGVALSNPISRDYFLPSPDLRLSLSIPEGIVLIDDKGNIVEDITIIEQYNSDEQILGNVQYELLPNMEANDYMILRYDYSDFIAVEDMKKLSIAYFDKGIWKAVPCLNNIQDKKLLCSIDHFTPFATQASCADDGTPVLFDTGDIEINANSFETVSFTLEDNNCYSGFSLSSLVLEGSITSILHYVYDATLDQEYLQEEYDLYLVSDGSCINIDSVDFLPELASGENRFKIGSDDGATLRMLFSVSGNLECGGGNSAISSSAPNCLVDPPDAFSCDTTFEEVEETEEIPTGLDYYYKRVNDEPVVFKMPIVQDNQQFNLEVNSPEFSNLISVSNDELSAFVDSIAMNDPIRVSGFKRRTNDDNYMSLIGIDELREHYYWIEISETEETGWQWVQAPDFQQYWIENSGSGNVYVYPAQAGLGIDASDLDTVLAGSPNPLKESAAPARMGVAYYRYIEDEDIYLGAVGTADDLSEEMELQWVKISGESTNTGWRFTRKNPNDNQCYCQSQQTVTSCTELVSNDENVFCGWLTTEDTADYVSCTTEEVELCDRSYSTPKDDDILPSPVTERSINITDEIDAYLLDQGINSCYYSVSLQSIDESIHIYAKEDDTIHMMSTFKGPLAAFYYMVVPADKWNLHSEGINNMLYSEQDVDWNIEAACVFKHIDDEIDQNVMEAFNQFLHDNGMSENAFVSRWSVQCGDYIPPSYGNLKPCGPDNGCNKAASAHDFNQFYALLANREISWDGTQINENQQTQIFDHLEHSDDFGFSGHFIDGSIYYNKGGSNGNAAIYQYMVANDAGIIETADNVYSAAVMTMDCGGWTSTLNTMNSIVEILADTVNDNNNGNNQEMPSCNNVFCQDDLTIVLFGDSITRGMDIYGDLESQLVSIHSGISLIEVGTNSQEASDLVDGSGVIELHESIQAVLTADPDVVLLWHGLNPTSGDALYESSSANLIEFFSSKGITPVVVSPINICSPSPCPIEDIRNQGSKLSQTYNIPFIDVFSLTEDYAEAWVNNPANANHPATSDYDMIAAIIANEFESLLGCCETNDNNGNQQLSLSKLVDKMSDEELISQLLMTRPQSRLSANFYLSSGDIDAGINPPSLFVEGIEIKPFVATDAEGGEIRRLPGDGRGTGNFLRESARKIGDENWNSNQIKSYAEDIAGEMSEHYLNLNLAPVLDVSESGPMVDQERSFSSNPDIVISMAGSFIMGMKNRNIMVTGKHFPGYGNQNGDTDRGQAIDSRSWEELQLHLEPYRTLNAELDFIMINSIIYSQIDYVDANEVALPAMLTEYFTQLARNIAPNAIIITDSLTDYEGNKKHNEFDLTFREMMILAARFNDVLLFSGPVVTDEAHAILVDAMNANDIYGSNNDKIIIKQKVLRILQVKDNYGLIS